MSLSDEGVWVLCIFRAMKFVLLLLQFVFVLSICAQQDDNRFTPERIGLQMDYGFVIPHRPHMKSLVKGHSPMIRLRSEWQYSGEKEWHKQYRMPSFGVEYQWTDLGNPEQLGYANALYTYLRLPLTGNIRFRQDLRLGLGIVHLSKRYDVEDNDKNLAAGSFNNAVLAIQYQSIFPISHRLNFTAGIGLTHFSNASYQIPNLGMNIVTVAAGFEFEADRATVAPARYKSEKRGNEVISYLSFGVNEDFPPGGPKYLALNLGQEYLKGISQKGSLIGRADIFYSEAINAALSGDGSSETSRAEAVQVGVALGYGLHFGEFLIRMMTGAYVIDNYGLNGAIYNRFGFQQNLSRHLSLAIGFKTHFAKAQHFDAGLAWRW